MKKISVYSTIIISLFITGCAKEKNQNFENNEEIINNLTITTNKGNVIETKYIKFDGFSIKVPTDFEIMSEETKKIKYPLANRPDLIYTNDNTSINIGLKLNDNTKIKNSDIKKYVELLQSLYKDISKDLKTNTYEIDGHVIGEIKLITQAIDTNIYNHIIVFSADNKFKMITFNCPENYMGEWKDVSDFIISSIIFE